MTPTEKQKCIAEQSVYGDLIGYDLKDTYYSKNPSTIVGFQGQLVYIGCDLNKVEAIKPILRPLSDLHKEITHKGYNNDQPFVPIDELERYCKKEYGDVYLMFRNEVFTMANYEGSRTVPNQQQLRDLLHLWHFDTRNLIQSNEAIDVNTLDINPYKVKL